LFLSVFKTGKAIPSTDGTETVLTVRRPISDGNRSDPLICGAHLSGKETLDGFRNGIDQTRG
jgi:hypothetical protein